MTKRPQLVPLRVSYSAVQDWRTCEQRYWYRYVEGLTPKVRQAAPELGTILHEFFANYYLGMQEAGGLRTQTAYDDALPWLRNEEKRVRKLARTAALLGADDVATSLRAIVPNAVALATAYYRVHRQEDAKHDVLAVEQEFELPVQNGIVLPGRIDLVTKRGKDIWLWEHKTTGSIPSQGHRFRDLQTLLYSIAVEEIVGTPPAGVIWNYVRTTPPHPPAALQNGSLSMAKNQITTIELYRAAIKENGLDPYKYDTILRQIETRERREMFPRYQLPILASPKVLLRDYVASVEQIATARNTDGFRPVRSIAQHCDWCPYVKLCQAAVTGGTTREIKEREFVREDRTQKRKE